MPNRKSPTCRGGFGQREKDEDDEERSHPGPISVGCLKILSCSVDRQTRKRAGARQDRRASKSLRASLIFDRRRSGQCSRHAPGAIAMSLATFNGGGRAPRRLASRRMASRVGPAAAIVARMTARGGMRPRATRQVRAPEAGDVAGVDLKPPGAVDHPEEGLLGQLGGVGRIADFTARGAEWRDEHGGGSLHGELPVSVWGTAVLIGLPQAQEDEEPAALAGARREFDDGGEADAFDPVEELRLSLRRGRRSCVPSPRPAAPAPSFSAP